MKKILLFSLLIALVCTLQAQNAFPNVTVKDLDGKDFNMSDLNTADHPIVVNFWATWCGPCMKEMAALEDVYEDWKDELGIEIISVSIDDAKTVKRVSSLVESKGWTFKILLDENQDLKRAMNVANPPHIFVIKDGKVLYQHTSYSPGSENKIYDVLKENL